MPTLEELVNSYNYTTANHHRSAVHLGNLKLKLSVHIYDSWQILAGQWAHARIYNITPTETQLYQLSQLS